MAMAQSRAMPFLLLHVVNMQSHLLHCTRNNRRCTHCGAVVAVRELEAHIAAMKGTAYVS